MPLEKTYSYDFERIYRVWPMWPKGRTKKALAAKAFESAKKEFEFTPSDIDELVLLIERMKKDRKSWQKGNTYGPQGLQVWLNQRGWLDEYETVKRSHKAFIDQPVETETPEQIAQKMRLQQERFEEARRQAELRKEMQRKGIA